MITILEGSPGHGKSYGLVVEIAETVMRGKPVCTNVPLRDDWPEVLGRHYTILGKFRKRAAMEKADKYRKLVFISDDVNELMKVRFHGSGESRGKIIYDEFHREANARVDRTTDQRKALVNHASAHRHYGADMTIATQAGGNLDTQIRNLAEYVSITRNFKKMPWFQIVIWFNLFVRQTYWNDKKRTKGPSKVYWLSKKIARLYDTHALDEADWPDDAIVLPVGSPCNRLHDRPSLNGRELINGEWQNPPDPTPISKATRPRAPRPGDEIRDSYLG